MAYFSLNGNLVDVHSEEIYLAEIIVENGKIRNVRRKGESRSDRGFILPGFIDAHVHIESSMLVPSEFARLAVVHGTVATVSDPHEIANVCGVDGVDFMIRNGSKVPFKFHFGAPSCVPATTFETAGAVLDSATVKRLLERDDIYYLSEMMNYPGVLNEDEEVMKKIAAAHHLLKPVDGHAPGLRNENAKKYIAAGITTDHECFTREEALDKLQNGMKIIIREGSAARNFEALADLLNDYPTQMMFCSDDKHPDSLVEGHINQLCARAVAKGIDLFKVLRAACINPAFHYKMNVGLLREGDAADFVVVKDLTGFEVERTYINGHLVADNGTTKIKSQPVYPINNFHCSKKTAEDFRLKGSTVRSMARQFPISPDEAQRAMAIQPIDGQLITNKTTFAPLISNGDILASVQEDVLKLVVVDRYKDAAVAKSFITNFGLKNGALASSVAHDSHNIIAAGTDDASICEAVNMLIASKGGISFFSDDTQMMIPLPIAGLMSDEDGYKIASQYSLIDKTVKQAGCTLSAPFMTLSFMALLVIPHLKLSDLGLFDSDNFQFVQ